MGGFAGNVSTALARLGVRARILARVGDDGHGEFIRRFLAGEGVDVSWLPTDPRYRTALVFCEAWPPDDFPILYYRDPTCPDWEVSFDDFDLGEAAAIPWALVTGTGLARSPSADVCLAIAEARADAGMPTVFDLDWRPMLWDDRRRYRALAGALLPLAQVVIGNESEFRALADGEPLDTARRTLERGPSTVVLKRGGAGVTALTGGGEEDIPGLPVEVVNGLGAGDAFVASLVHGLLRGLPVAEACRRGNAAGAIVATRLACSEAMPTRGRGGRAAGGPCVSVAPASQSGG